MSKTTGLKIAVAALLLAGGAHHMLQEQARAEAVEVAAEAFFADPGFSHDYAAPERAAQWEEVEEKRGADPLQVMLARKARR